MENKTKNLTFWERFCNIKLKKETNDQLLERILSHSAPEYYRQLTIIELLARQIN